MGHVPQLEAPVSTARAVTGWLRAAGRGAAEAAAPRRRLRRGRAVAAGSRGEGHPISGITGRKRGQGGNRRRVTGRPALMGPDVAPGGSRRRVGLVLGAGGVLGAAWMTGALPALQELLPCPLADVNLVVGTSAGSVLAAALRCGAASRR